MSDSLQYLNAAGDTVSGDAAQSFLQGKLKDQAKGRYTSEQLERLGQSGGFAVVNANDGALTDGSPAYDADNPSKNGGSGSSGGGGGKYGSFSVADYKEKFGLDKASGEVGANYNEASGATDSDKTKDNAVLGKGYLSDDKFEDLKGDKKFQDLYMEKAVDFKNSKVEKIKSGDMSFEDMSINHMDSFLDEFAGDLEGAGEEKKNDPIEHSPELKQATERVRTYENDVMSGKISEDIFGSISNTETDSGPSAAFDSSKGMAGIGTEGGVTADNSAYKATNSFLDNKKTAVKKEFNFQPVQTSYGS